MRRPSDMIRLVWRMGFTPSRSSRDDGTEVYDAPVSTSAFSTSNSVPDGLPNAIGYRNVPIDFVLPCPIRGAGGRFVHDARLLQSVDEFFGGCDAYSDLFR